MPAKPRFYNLEPTADNFRALWDRVHTLDEALTAQNAIIRGQNTTISQLQASVQQAMKTAKTALQGIPLPAPTGGGGTPVEHLEIPNHLADVQAIWNAAQPTVPSLEWGFKRTQELAWQFRNEIVQGVPFAMGLLLSGGSNLYTCGGITYKVGRVIYPDGHIFKILTDIPTTMDPSWQDDGFVDPSQYSVATDPSLAC